MVRPFADVEVRLFAPSVIDCASIVMAPIGARKTPSCVTVPALKVNEPPAESTVDGLPGFACTAIEPAVGFVTLVGSDEITNCVKVDG